MGQADTGGFLIAEAHEIVVAVDGMGEPGDALPSSDVMEHAEDTGFFRIDVIAAHLQAFGNGFGTVGGSQGMVFPGAGIALPAFFQKPACSVEIRNHDYLLCEAAEGSNLTEQQAHTGLFKKIG